MDGERKLSENVGIMKGNEWQLLDHEENEGDNRTMNGIERNTEEH